jgi:hypothetical protein
VKRSCFFLFVLSGLGPAFAPVVPFPDSTSPKQSETRRYRPESTCGGCVGTMEACSTTSFKETP